MYPVVKMLSVMAAMFSAVLASYFMPAILPALAEGV